MGVLVGCCGGLGGCELILSVETCRFMDWMVYRDSIGQWIDLIKQIGSTHFIWQSILLILSILS